MSWVRRICIQSHHCRKHYGNRRPGQGLRCCVVAKEGPCTDYLQQMSTLNRILTSR